MRRAAFWAIFVGSFLVIVGVLIQAFSIAAYVRGAGQAALDVHSSDSIVVHIGELAIVLGALWAWWGRWSVCLLTIGFLAVSVLQLVSLGDTDEPGGWVNGFHGLLALVLLLAAGVYGYVAAKQLRLRERPV